MATHLFFVLIDNVHSPIVTCNWATAAEDDVAIVVDDASLRPNKRRTRGPQSLNIPVHEIWPESLRAKHVVADDIE